MDDNLANGFDAIAAAERPGLVSDLWCFLSHTKKWWLFPVVVVLLVSALLMLTSGSAIAPFIYSLF